MKQQLFRISCFVLIGSFTIVMFAGCGVGRRARFRHIERRLDRLETRVDNLENRK